MKKRPLTLVAAACALALTACSSQHNQSVLPTKANNAVAAKTPVKQQDSKRQEQTKNPAQQSPTQQSPTQQSPTQQSLSSQSTQNIHLPSSPTSQSTQADLHRQVENQQPNQALTQPNNVDPEPNADQRTEMPAGNTQPAVVTDSEKPTIESGESTESSATVETSEKPASEIGEAVETPAVEPKQEDPDAKLKAQAELARIQNNATEMKKTVVAAGDYKDVSDETIQYLLEDFNASGLSYVSGRVIENNHHQITSHSVEAQHKDLNHLILDGQKIELYTVSDVRKSNDQEYDSPYLSKTLEITRGDTRYTGKVSTLPIKIGDADESYRERGFEQLRYGYLVDNNGKDVLFVQGHLTPETKTLVSPYSHLSYGRYSDAQPLNPMRTAGVWLYDYGTAYYGKDGQYNEFGVKAVADLNHKKVKVNILENNQEKLTLGGVIEGNTFSGSHNGVQTQGAFYGDQGQDIGGTFYQTQGAEKDYQGVFGATIKLSKKGTGGSESAATASDSLSEFQVEK